MFDHKKVYHSAFAKADEPVKIRVTSDVQKSQFKDQGMDWFYISFEHDGKEHQLKIENEGIKRQLNGLKGRLIEVRASGKGEEAAIEIRDLGADGRVASPPIPPSQPAARHQPPVARPAAHDAIKKARAALTRSANGYILASRAASYVAGVIEHELQSELSEEHFRTLTATLFIRLDRSGLIDDLPLKLEEDASPKAAQPPPPPPEPESAPDEDDFGQIPF